MHSGGKSQKEKPHMTHFLQTAAPYRHATMCLPTITSCAKMMLIVFTLGVIVLD